MEYGMFVPTERGGVRDVSYAVFSSQVRATN